MTSEERREARYQRRVKRRAEKKERKYSGCDDFDQVFSYGNLYRSYKKCRRGVAWKASVQKYITQAPLLLNQTYGRLQDGTFRSGGFYKFDLNERGKLRHIKSVTINERVVQRCLCDYALVPVLGRTFVYDNGASMEHKGYTFSIKRLCQHLREHYRKYGTDGYILLFDFSKFFDNVSHEVIKKDYVPGIYGQEDHRPDHAFCADVRRCWLGAWKPDQPDICPGVGKPAGPLCERGLPDTGIWPVHGRWVPDPREQRVSAEMLGWHP